MSERDFPTSRLLLIGMKHCGKSTLGRMVAAHLSLPFYDLDRLILARIRPAGYSSVRELYRNAGAGKFQEYEYAAAVELAELLRGHPLIAALGGGTVENTPAMEVLTPHARVIHLDVEENELFRRISQSGIPPFLEGKEEPRVLFSRLYRRRAPLYEHWAHEALSLPVASPEENFSRLLKQLETEENHVG